MKTTLKSILKFTKLYPIVVFAWCKLNPKIVAAQNKEREAHEKFKSHLQEIFSNRQLRAIQIGSNDGVSNDPLREHILKNDWEAILVEPVPSVFRRLERLYSDNPKVKTLNLAISPSTKSVMFFAVDERAKQALGSKCPPWFDQLGSFKKQNIINHLDGILEEFITEITVEVDTINNLIEKYKFENFDVLHIDAEGYDLTVMQTIDLDVYRPKFIIIEHKHMDVSRKNLFLKEMSDIGYCAKIYHDDIVFTDTLANH